MLSTFQVKVACVCVDKRGKALLHLSAPLGLSKDLFYRFYPCGDSDYFLPYIFAEGPDARLLRNYALDHIYYGFGDLIP